MATLTRLSLEVLKPHKPDLIEITGKLSRVPGVDGVRADLRESDTNTETISLSLEGELDYGRIKELIEEAGGVIHSLNTVVAGKLREE